MLLAAAPFLVLLFATSSKYTRSLRALLGVEPGALELLVGFLLLLLLFASGYLAARCGSTAAVPRWLAVGARLALPIHVLLLPLLLWQPSLTDPLLHSDVFHSLDTTTSTLIERSVRPWSLVAEFRPVVSAWFRWGLGLYGALFLAVLLLRRGGAAVGDRLRQRAPEVLAAVSGAAVFYLLFVCHWGFATGVAVTLRAAVFAYLLAALLGLVWTGLQSLRPAPLTFPLHAGASILLLAGAAFFWSQPQVNHVLVGSTAERIAISQGTPQRVADAIRFGEFADRGGEPVRIRSTPDTATALEQIDTLDSVSGALIPTAAHDGSLPLLWETRFLPDRHRNPALVLTVIGLLLFMLTCGGALHRLHPLAVGAEFLVDTLRGIPMLVIILYVGLPLSGAVKEATGGGIDLPNFARGVIAIAIGYSAYMAEIFRSGIEAVPPGQQEAGKSIGLSRWQSTRLVVLPQALRIVVPPLGNEFIAMIKDTSLLSILSVRDVTQRMREFQSASFLPFAPFNTAAILYVVITLACSSFLKWIERRHAQRHG